MPTLTQETLLAHELPSHWAPVLDALAAIDDLASGPVHTKPQRQELARRHYAEMLRHSAQYMEPVPEHLQSTSKRFRAWFTEAVLLWTRLNRAGSAALVDTVGSKTLSKFPVDLPLDSAALSRIESGLRASLDLQAAEFKEAQRRVEHLTSNLELKGFIALRIAEHLKSGDGPTPRKCIELFNDFYGPVPWEPGDIDWVVTKTSVFPCLPRKGQRLAVDNWTQRGEREKAKITEFLRRLQKANTANTERFPCFGLFEPDQLSPTIRKVLCQAAPAPESVILETLKTMVMVLPTQQVDQYLVHDVWGHTWQEALSEFEWEYALVPFLGTLTPDDGPRFGGITTPPFKAAFVERAGHTELDEGTMLSIAEADLRGRVQITASVALSEMLADYMESKFARAQGDEAITTSSLIHVEHLKIDLSTNDLRTQLQRYTKPYRALAEDVEAQAEFARRLVALGLPEAGATEAVAAAGRLIWEHFSVAFDTTIPARAVSESSLQSSVYRRLLLQFVLTAEELETALKWAGHADYLDPISCPDLFVIALTHLYEQDRQRNFWHMDQVMRTEYPKACAALKSALA